MEKVINEPRGPWFTRTRGIVHSNKYGLKVLRDEVVRPNGSTGIYDYLEVSSGAYALPLDSHGNVYLVRQFRYPANRDSIEVVSGGKNHDEEFLDSAKRELREELGIQAEQWNLLMEIGEPAPHILSSPQQLFLARGLNFGRCELDEAEKGNMSKVVMSLEDAVSAVTSGKISEMPSALTIMLAYNYLRRQ